MTEPYFADEWVTLYLGDALDVLRQLPTASVDCCVSSPPYWGLRDYGVDGQLGLKEAMRDKARIEREHRGQRVLVGPRKGQTPESVEADIARSFEFGERILAEGTQAWTSHYRWVGPFKLMAYKEVGPPPWKWPKIGVQTKGGRNCTVRFIVGWRTTAYALVVMWIGRAEGRST